MFSIPYTETEESNPKLVEILHVGHHPSEANEEGTSVNESSIIAPHKQRASSFRGGGALSFAIPPKYGILPPSWPPLLTLITSSPSKTHH